MDNCGICFGENADLIECCDGELICQNLEESCVSQVDECGVCNEPICADAGIPSPFTGGQNPCENSDFPISQTWNSSCLDCTGTPNGNGCFSQNCDQFPIELYNCADGSYLSVAEALPTEYNLYQNYPNPFNPITNISFDIPTAGFVKINIYDVNGYNIRNLVSNYFAPGSYNVSWNASMYPSGVYFYSIKSNDFIKTNKMLLIK